MNSLYLESGYVNMGPIISDRLHPFAFVWGGRATGKTYGSIEYLIKNEIKFLFMRRTQAQLDMINRPMFSPLNPILQNHPDWHIVIDSVTDKNYGFFWDRGDGKPDPERIIGFTAALSTISNLRGFAGAESADVILFDEFIPEAHERPIKSECDALLNAYETVNRNRELLGRPALKMVCLANSNQLTNPIFEGLGLTKKVRTMRKHRAEVSYDDKRGIALYALDNSPISLRKRDTALYRLSGIKSKFADMALDNAFSWETGSRIESRSLNEYSPCVAVGNWCLYKHKSRPEYYACQHISGSPPHYVNSAEDKARFMRAYDWVWSAYLRNQIVFEDESSEHILTTIFC